MGDSEDTGEGTLQGVVHVLDWFLGTDVSGGGGGEEARIG